MHSSSAAASLYPLRESRAEPCFATREPTREKRARPGLGTFVEIDIDILDGGNCAASIAAAFDEIARVERIMSAHRACSDVGRINAAAVNVPISIDSATFDVLAAAQALHRDSDGLFDCAIAPQLEQRGLLPHSPHNGDGNATCADLELIAPGGVVKKKALRIDLGGIAKGYAVDRAVVALIEAGATSGCVNAGGDLRVFGRLARRIHVRDPDAPTRWLALIDLQDSAIATSGNYFTREAKRDALITPTTAEKVSRTRFDAGASISVRAPCCMLADALTKVVALSGDAGHPLLARLNAEAIILERRFL